MSFDPVSSPTDTTTPALDLVVEMGALDRPHDWDALFGRRAPMELEIGFGSGYFLSRHAVDHPELNLIGIEKAVPEVHRTHDKCRRLLGRARPDAPPNVRLLRGDALYFLEEGFVAPGSLSVVHIYYPDPWPKTRHHRRRLFQPALVPLLERVLAPGGELRIRTDVTEYFDVVKATMAGATLLDLVDERRLDLNPLPNDFETNFQRKARAKGHPLHYQLWRRKESAP